MDDVKARFEAITLTLGKLIAKAVELLNEAAGAVIRAVRDATTPEPRHSDSQPAKHARTSLSPRDWLLAAAAFAGAAAALVFLLGIAVRDNTGATLVPLKERVTALGERLDKTERVEILLADRVAAAETALAKTSALTNSTIAEMKKMQEALSAQAAPIVSPGGTIAGLAGFGRLEKRIAALENQTVAAEAPLTEETHESKAAGSHGETAFPPFDPANFTPLLVWLALSFGLLYLLMSKIALPRVENILHTRAHTISNNISEANALRTQAEEASAAHDKTIADAKAKAVALAQATHAKLNSETETKRLALEAELHAKIAASEAQILEMKTKALGNVEGIARETAAAIVQHITGKPADQTAIAKALATIKA